jgi:hypothetical protein
MGFWKNTNGAKVIGGANQTSLAAYLKLYNPFQDYSPTSQTIAAYVANVIGAASCTSSTNTCNSMLRAQMLATALDVYFSDPLLGGNQIGAYNGLGSKTPALGGVVVNLSQVCAIVDGSSSTCSGVNEDVRPEFGIAAPCLGTTISSMLAYANYPSLVNGNPVATSQKGATWYGQLKAKQVPAKDAFDAFNNNIANIAPAGCTATPF